MYVIDIYIYINMQKRNTYIEHTTHLTSYTNSCLRSRV